MMLSDEEYGEVLLRALDDEPRTPSTVDIARALADGRRRRRTRRASAYCASAAAVLLLLAGAGLVAVPALREGPAPAATQAPPLASTGPESAAPTAAPPSPDAAPSGASVPLSAAAVPTKCSVARLAIPAGRVKSIITGGDPTCRYIVGRSYHSGPGSLGLRVWIWDNGTAREVRMPAGDQALEDINESGVAVGSAWATGDPEPYIYRGGQLTRLPGISKGDAVAINKAGVIVGNDDTTKRPVIWRSPTEAPVPLDVPAGAMASARDIDDDGTVVGGVNGRAYLWTPDGKGDYLPDLRPGGPTGDATGIRGDWVIGVVGSDRTGLRWNRRTREVIETTQFDGRPEAVNAHGWMTGFDTQGHGVLVTPAGTLVMPDFQRHRAGGFTNMPYSISDDGRVIAGQAYDKSLDDNLAVVWRCQP